MKIILDCNTRILIKDNNDQLDISDGNTILYKGLYYKKKDNNFNYDGIETKFIGIIECERYKHDEGIQGIYIKPTFIFNNELNKWYKIANYESPKNKYFLYPHLLMLPNQYYHYKPLYFLHTCESVNFNDLDNIIETFNL
jgi:hypothetical protein